MVTTWTEEVTSPIPEGTVVVPIVVPKTILSESTPIWETITVVGGPAAKVDHLAGPGPFDPGLTLPTGTGGRITSFIVLDFSSLTDPLDFSSGAVHEVEVGHQALAFFTLGCDWRFKIFDGATEIGSTITVTGQNTNNPLLTKVPYDPNLLIDTSGAGLRLRVEVDWTQDLTNFDSPGLNRINWLPSTLASIWTAE